MSMLSVAVNRARAARFEPRVIPPPPPPAEIKLWMPLRHYDLKTIVANLLPEYEPRPQVINTCEEPKPSRPTVNLIKRLVRQKYEITECEMCGPSHHRRYARPRQIAVYLCARYTMNSLPVLGRLFNRDHSTLVHARDKIAALRVSDPGTNADITDLECQLGVR